VFGFMGAQDDAYDALPIGRLLIPHLVQIEDEIDRDTLNDPEPVTEKVVDLVWPNRDPFRFHRDSGPCPDPWIPVNHVAQGTFFKRNVERMPNAGFDVGKSRGCSIIVRLCDSME
jgi:hypothetical protein